ncbi:MAG: hypothetical protein Q7N50_02955 [Armatimonadota bacterium]|nr:hypothetical protein [Armatimonadota bacterium]
MESKAKLTAEFEAIAQAQAERISELEEEIARLKGGKAGVMQIKASVKKKDDKKPRKNRSSSFARKISGGTRSAKGSHAHSVLRSLFETWSLQGHNGIVACREMIIEANRKAIADCQ